MQHIISNLSETELVQIALNDDENKKPLSPLKYGPSRGINLLKPNKLRNEESNLNMNVNINSNQRLNTEANRPSQILNISPSPNSFLNNIFNNESHKLFSMG